MKKVDVKKSSELIIVVTRVGTSSEWTEWGFEKGEIFSYINLENFGVKVCQKNEINMQYLCKAFSAADICVFNGDFFPSIINNELGKIEWDEFGRDLEVRIHGENVYKEYIRSDLDDGVEENIRNLLSGYDTYGLGGKPLIENQCAEALIGLAVKNRDRDALREAVSRLRASRELERDVDERVPDLASRFSTLKHRLSHLFIPLSVDLQGWRDSGFSSRYAEEIAEEYEGRTDIILEKSKSIIDDIKEVISLVDKSREKDIESILENLSDENSEPNNTLDIIERIDERKYAKELKKSILNENEFKNWFSSLERDLDEIRDSVF